MRILLLDLLVRRITAADPLVRFLSDRFISISEKSHYLEKPIVFVSDRVISLQVRAIDRYVPDQVLLFLMNVLDKYVPPRAIEVVIDEVDRFVPDQVISSLLHTADEYVPDSVASSRKASTVIAGVGKYVPDRVIPPESRSTWANLKMKFHIPTLLSRGQFAQRKD